MAPGGRKQVCLEEIRIRKTPNNSGLQASTLRRKRKRSGQHTSRGCALFLLRQSGTQRPIPRRIPRAGPPIKNPQPAPA